MALIYYCQKEFNNFVCLTAKTFFFNPRMSSFKSRAWLIEKGGLCPLTPVSYKDPQLFFFSNLLPGLHRPESVRCV